MSSLCRPLLSPCPDRSDHSQSRRTGPQLPTTKKLNLLEPVPRAVQVFGRLPAGIGRVSLEEVAVRDSKDTPGPVLSFPHEAWLGFVAGLKG